VNVDWSEALCDHVLIVKLDALLCAASLLSTGVKFNYYVSRLALTYV
jgi:hypothetical protein